MSSGQAGRQPIGILGSKAILRAGVAVALGVLWAVPISPAHAATLAVNSTEDAPDASPGNGACATAAGACTLRAALQEANSSVGVADVIRFSIAGAGPHTIAPLSALPKITDPVTVDGYSQPGAAPATTSAPAVIKIQLDGAAAGSQSGIEIATGYSTIKGLSIVGFGRYGLSIVAPGLKNNIHGNYIGLAADGVTASPNVLEGLSINGSKGNKIGDGTPAARNVISGNGSSGPRDGIEVTGSKATANTIKGNYIGTDHTGTVGVPNVDDGITIDEGRSNKIVKNLISGNRGDGVLIHGGKATKNQIKGNLIGTDKNGTTALPNGDNGVQIWGVLGNVVGGTSKSTLNVISGNGGRGVRIAASPEGLPAANNEVLGNYIGTDKAGVAAIRNFREGVLVLDSKDNTIGGTSTAAGNVISGNRLDGVEIAGSMSTGNRVRGNFIGATKAGSPLPNGDDGVTIDGASGNVIGGTVSGTANVVAFNADNGVLVRGVAKGNWVQGNSIHSNAKLGIELEPLGVTANDAGDVDDGPNELQNFPEVQSATYASGVLAAGGVLNSKASTAYTIELFANAECDASGYGEAARYLGSIAVTTGADGSTSFNSALSIAMKPGDAVITATATDGAGNTSELSECRQLGA